MLAPQWCPRTLKMLCMAVACPAETSQGEECEIDEHNYCRKIMHHCSEFLGTAHLSFCLVYWASWYCRITRACPAMCFPEAEASSFLQGKGAWAFRLKDKMTTSLPFPCILHHLWLNPMGLLEVRDMLEMKFTEQTRLGLGRGDCSDDSC